MVELEHNFARHYGCRRAGRLARRRPAVRYVGQALGPEYFIVTAPGADFGAEAEFAVVFAPLRTAQSLSGERGRVNELVLRMRPGAGIAAGSGRARPLAATRHCPAPASRSPPAARSPRAAALQGRRGRSADDGHLRPLLLGAAAFAAFNLVSRTVEAQRREIGIGMALGVRPRVLARRPLLLGGQVASWGRARHPGGLAANAWLRSVMQSFFPLPVLRTPCRSEFRPRRALGLAVSLLATRSRCAARSGHAGRGDPGRRAGRARAAGSPGSPAGSGFRAAASRTCRCATCCARPGAPS